MTEQPIRVLLADDHELVRAGLALLVDSQPDMTVVAQASDGMEAITLTRDQRPDIVLMDIRMPVLDGLAATRRILADPTTGATRVVVLTTYDLDEYVYDTLRSGASGFLLKHAPPEELLLGIRAAGQGNALLAPAVTTRLIAAFASGPARSTRPPAQFQQLTDRERDVFLLVAQGMTNNEIAKSLHIAETTVRTHLAHALTKLALRDRVHAVIYAYQHGLSPPGTDLQGRRAAAPPTHQRRRDR
jgi:DNA-binding NarL/FixJ family response regulator